jgi:D-citramalate synthase
MPPSTRKVQILDTTLRDGEQTRWVSFSPAEKLNIAQALLQLLKVDRIEVASARVSRGEAEAADNILEWADLAGVADRVEILGFVDHKRSVDWIHDVSGRVINLLTKGSEKHCLGQLKKTLAEHLDDIHGTLDYAHEKGLAANVYLEDWSNGYRDNPDYVYRLVEGLADQGIDHIMLPDTLGVMTPDQVYDSVADMIQRFPGQQFDFHPHNDYGLATANALMAVKAGASTIHCTVNCLGERAGNVSLAEVAVNLKDRLGVELAIDEQHIMRLSQMVENFSGKRVAENTPIVGADVFTQTSGIHADGDQKGDLYHTALRPERFARNRSYALGKLSGKASLVKNLEALDITLAEADLEKVLKRVVELGDSKSSVTSEDLPFIITEVLQGREYDDIELLNCSVTSGLDLESTASIRIRVGEQITLASGIGNGGFDAFMNALRKTLPKQGIAVPRLVDYEVRIPRGGKSDALTECFITWDAEEEMLRTRGVHANQVFAAIKATVRMLNLQIQKHHLPVRPLDTV